MSNTLLILTMAVADTFWRPFQDRRSEISGERVPINHHHHHVHEGLACFLFLNPQDEVGLSIFPSVVLCFFVLLVYIVAFVLVFYLCLSSVRVVANFGVILSVGPLLPFEDFTSVLMSPGYVTLCMYTVWQLYNGTDFILTKIEVPSMMKCMPSMCPDFICNLATPQHPTLSMTVNTAPCCAGSERTWSQ